MEHQPYRLPLGCLRRPPRAGGAPRRAYEHLNKPYAASNAARSAAQMTFFDDEEPAQ
ncbi:MAG: hypothetical protein ACTHNK_17635 [Thermomicrobiales bacterium]